MRVLHFDIERLKIKQHTSVYDFCLQLIVAISRTHFISFDITIMIIFLFIIIVCLC